MFYGQFCQRLRHRNDPVLVIFLTKSDHFRQTNNPHIFWFLWMISHSFTQTLILLILQYDVFWRRACNNLRVFLHVKLIQIFYNRMKLNLAELVRLSPWHRILNLLLELLDVCSLLHLLLRWHRLRNVILFVVYVDWLYVNRRHLYTLRLLFLSIIFQLIYFLSVTQLAILSWLTVPFGLHVHRSTIHRVVGIIRGVCCRICGLV